MMIILIKTNIMNSINIIKSIIIKSKYLRQQ